MTSLSENTVVTTSGGLVELGYSESGTATTVAYSASGWAGATWMTDALTFVSDGSPLLIEYYSPTHYNDTANNQTYVGFGYDGADPTGFRGFLASASSGTYRTPAYINERVVLSAGVHTVRVKAFKSVNSGVAGFETAGRYLRVSKIIQASQFIVPLASVPSVTSLPTSPINGQEVNLYSQYGYTRQLWDGAQWNIVSDNRKVYFHANTSTILGTTAGTTMAFNRTTVNQGNCFNTSTYLFTAPFAGDYKFRVQAQKRNAGVMQMYWLINGSTTNNRGVYTDIGSDSVGPNMEIILNLAANTTVGVYYTLSAGDVYGGSTEYFTYFQGEYLA